MVMDLREICERCRECDEPTGNAGNGEGSFYDDSGAGPYCEECWGKRFGGEREVKCGVVDERKKIMKPHFWPGDLVYVVVVGKNEIIGPLKIGKVSVEYTNSPGTGNPDEIGDNYKPQSGIVERYMCVETGVGSGSVFYSKTVFRTRFEAEIFLSGVLVGMECMK